jgi:DNA primase
VSGRLSQTTIEEVKERADLLELARADTELRKAGIEWVGRCPFHQERSGSFYVNPVKGLYHC